MELEKSYVFLLDMEKYEKILQDLQMVAYRDQIIYRFSKLQDIMGAKLFKSLFLYLGENVDKPFLDILNALEKMNLISVDEWFELRYLRNGIAHEYGESDGKIGLEILNSIYTQREELRKILENIDKVIK